MLFVLPCLAQEPVTIDLDTNEGLTIAAPSGFNQATHSFGPVPDGEGTNGLGLTIIVESAEGLLLYGPPVETGPGRVLVECSVWTNTPDLSLALAGLNAPIDGSLVANMPANGAEYVGSWHTMDVVYDPKDDAIVPAFQVAASSDVLGIVYVDQIVVTPLLGLSDAEALSILRGSVEPTPAPTIPAPVSFLDPIIDTIRNTAVFTAWQIDNIVATQGVVSLMAGDGTETGGNTMISLRLSDAAISFNGGTFYRPGQTTHDNTPTGIALDVRTSVLLRFLDVSTDTRLNVGGGLMGDRGFEEGTTLEDIRSQVESRINSALAGLVMALQVLSDPASTVFTDAMAASELNGLVGAGANIPATLSIGVPSTPPQVGVHISDDGSLQWSIHGGNLGEAVESVPANPTLDDARQLALETSAGGAGKLAPQLDLAARTRSIRVSTARESVVGVGSLVRDNRVDDVVAGGVTGFTATPFETTSLGLAFTVGDTDYAGVRGGTAVDVNGNLLNNDPTGTRPFEQTLPLAAPVHDPRDTDVTDAHNPNGVFDSGVQIIALTDGVYSNDMSRPDAEETAGLFGGYRAFAAVNLSIQGFFAGTGVRLLRSQP